MQDVSASVKDLIQSYAVQRPSEVPTLYSILKLVVLPALGHRNLKSNRIKDLADLTPAFKLYSLIELDGRAWREEVRKRLPPGQTYQKAYLRSIKRLIAHGEELGLLEPDEFLLAPEWRLLMSALEDVLASDTVSRRSGLKTAFRRLASWASQRALLPSDLPLSDESGRHMRAFHAEFSPDRDSAFYRARSAWRRLRETYPDLGLQNWEDDRPILCRGLPRSQWPISVQEGLDGMLAGELVPLRNQETRKGYESTLSIYLGTLMDLGVDVPALLEDVVDGRRSLRLLFQGMPPGYRKVEGLAHAQQLLSDPAFKTRYLDALEALDGVFEGRASDANPLVIAASNALLQGGKVASAFNLFVKTLAINRNALGMTDRHTEWCRKGRQQLSLATKRMPSAYALKKRSVFRKPSFWEDLVKARARLRVHTETLDRRWREAMGGQVTALKDQWAVALRNEVFFGLILCYPLRARNFSMMRLERHYDPAKHRIYFSREETKNDKEIDYELPEGGSLGDLRQLIEVYLNDARPVLLAGRQSPYFFVPNRLGGTRIPTRGFNLILGAISRQFLEDVLPDGVSELNPHLLRHAAANYHLTIGQNLNLAAQILNDSPATVTKSYADVLENRKHATKHFLSNFTLSPL